MSAKNGGPAFPNAHYNGKGGYDTSGGMTLRDYFASSAMNGILASGVDLGEGGLANWAYRYADAMLAAREAK